VVAVDGQERSLIVVEISKASPVCREFVEQAKRFLAECPQIRHAWEYADGSHCTLEIPVQCEGGFAITVEVSAEEIMVGAGGAHTNLIFDDGDPKEFAGRALGLVRDLA